MPLLNRFEGVPVKQDLCTLPVKSPGLLLVQFIRKRVIGTFVVAHGTKIAKIKLPWKNRCTCLFRHGIT